MALCQNRLQEERSVPFPKFKVTVTETDERRLSGSNGDETTHSASSRNLFVHYKEFSTSRTGNAAYRAETRRSGRAGCSS